MNLNKPILLSSVILFIILLVLFELNANLQAQKTLTAQELYKKYCASCHGADGKGVEKIAKMLKTEIKDITKVSLTTELSKEWTKIIKEGKGKMVAYKTKLKEAEIDSVFNYMKTMTLAPVKTESSVKKDTNTVSKDTTKKK